MKPFVKERRFFPDPENTLADGLVMVGGELSLDNLLEAYSFGIFPWPQPDLPTLWFSPERRGVLDFKDVHWARSFLKLQRSINWKITVNQSFEQVIHHCAQVTRPGQSGTWITPAIEKAYVAFHRAGYAHSIECWSDDVLIGGRYGVYVGGVFAGESMFYKRDNASKLCLWWVIEHLKKQGHTWMDTQMVTEGLKSMGGKYISRQEFLQRLTVEQKKPFVPFKI